MYWGRCGCQALALQCLRRAGGLQLGGAGGGLTRSPQSAGERCGGCHPRRRRGGGKSPFASARGARRALRHVAWVLIQTKSDLGCRAPLPSASASVARAEEQPATKRLPGPILLGVPSGYIGSYNETLSRTRGLKPHRGVRYKSTRSISVPSWATERTQCRALLPRSISRALAPSRDG